MASDIKVAIITNVPAPYRVPVWRRVAEAENIHLDVIFCAQPHIDTSTDTDDYGFSKHFLTGRYLAFERRFLHCDPGIWSLLNRLQPEVVITTGYIPTYLIGFAWAVSRAVPHIAMTDGTLNSEQKLSWAHRLLRRMILRRSAAFVGTCEGSRNLFRKYGVPDQRIHLSYLCADNPRFNRTPSTTPADFIFCGRFVAHKQPLFVLQVAHEVAKRLGRKTKALFVGTGIMEEQMRANADGISKFVDCRFPGYASQAELPQYYADAKIFMFPSEWDPWGVVANEACASGLPVIVSPYAGVASELVIDGYNGYICELDVKLWAEAAVRLLRNDELYSLFSQNSRAQVAKYSFENSASGLINAIKQASTAAKDE